MFGDRYFPPRYFGNRFWGGIVAVVADTGTTYYHGGEWDLESLRVTLRDRRIPRKEREQEFETAALEQVKRVADPTDEVRRLITEATHRLSRIQRQGEQQAAIEAMLERATALARQQQTAARERAEALEFKRMQDNDALALLLLAA